MSDDNAMSAAQRMMLKYNLEALVKSPRRAGGEPGRPGYLRAHSGDVMTTGRTPIASTAVTTGS